MAFCTNCGKSLKDGALFCSACGTPKNSSNVNHYQYSEHRQSVYVGNVRKCPSCGAELSSFTAFCPQCGHELNSVVVPESIKDFSTQLNMLDTEIANIYQINSWKEWESGKKFWWIVINIFTLGIPLFLAFLFHILGIGKSGRFSSIEKKKESFINNYSFPNERESVLEALLFIKSQVVSLSTKPKNGKNKKWIRIWDNKAKELLNKSKLLLSEDIIAQNAYNEIVAIKNKVNKSIIVKSLILVIAIIISSSVVFINIWHLPIISFFTNNITKSTIVPTIGIDEKTNEKEGVYSYSIRNYIGQNVASIGENKLGFKMVEYGKSELKIVLVTENGAFVNYDDNEEMKKYTVTQQNPPAGTNLTIVHNRDSKGEVESYSVSYQSYDEIVLYVTPIGQEPYKTNSVPIKPTLDKHIYHIRDYIGRNAASFGDNFLGDYRYDEYGKAVIQINFAAEDGSYVDYKDVNALKQYIVTKQDIDANTELVLSFDTDRNGNENTWVQSQNIEEITLLVKKIK